MKYKIKNIKKITFILGILFIVIGFSIFIRDAFFRPTTLNSFIVSKLYSEPVNSYFKDQNFYNCVIDAYNNENETEHSYDYNLSDEELLMITTLNCSNKGVTDTSGIEKIINLVNLSLNGNQLTKLDISNNAELIKLYVSMNELTELDISNNTSLIELSISDNELTKLDTSKNIALTTLNVNKNKLIELDLKNNSSLETLNAYDNQLTNLDISSNQNLLMLSIYNNQLTSLDVSANLLLRQLIAYNNLLIKLDLANNSLLTNIVVHSNKLTNLDVSRNLSLEYFSISDNKIDNLDVSQNVKLKHLYVNNNQLTKLDLSKNTELKNLEADNNQLTELNVSENTNLVSLSIASNKFQSNSISYVGEIAKFVSPVKLLSSSINDINEINPLENSANLVIDENNNVVTNKAGEYELQITYKYVSNHSDAYYTINSNLYAVELTSNKYGIDNNNNVIYIPRNEVLNSENLLSNLSINNEDVNIVYEDKKIKVIYEEEILKEFSIDTIELASTSEIIEITDAYIWTLSGVINETDVKTSFGTVSINENKLEVTYNDIVIDTFDIVKFVTTNYILYDNNIFIGINDIDLNNILVTNATLNVNEDELEVAYKEQVIKTFNILSIKFNDLKVFNTLITISSTISYEDFINKIEPNGVTYKIYDKKESEAAEDVLITSGDISNGMRVAVYKDETLLAIYTITNNYLDMGDLDIDNENNYLLNIEVNMTVSDLLEQIDTNGSKNITDKNGNNLMNEQMLATGQKLKIELSNVSYEYTLIVKGDTDGDGEVTAGDAYDIILHSIDKKLLDGVYLEAAYVDDDENITAGDAYDIILFSIGKKKEL